VRAALEDDLNTPLARTHLRELADQINRASSDAERAALQTALATGGRLMGLLKKPPHEWFQDLPSPSAWQQAGMITPPPLRRRPDPTNIGSGLSEPLLPPSRESQAGSPDVLATITRRIAARALARKERRFAEADHIRAELAAEGIILEDKPDGTTTWRRGV
jgi:cysteinyl-tRNA synthetase